MAERRTKRRGLEPVVEQFALRLARDFGATEVYLYGSRARGNQHRWSDYDFIVVSPRFAEEPFAKRGKDLRQLWYALGAKEAIEILCLTPDEFDRRKDGLTFLSHILHEALRVA